MTDGKLILKCAERAKIFQQAMESCHSSSPIDCIEWFADRIAELEKDCEEYSKTFNRQNDEIVSLREKMIKAKEIIRSLYFIIQGRIDYKGNIPLEDEMYRAEQFLKKVSE